MTTPDLTTFRGFFAELLRVQHVELHLTGNCLWINDGMIEVSSFQHYGDPVVILIALLLVARKYGDHASGQYEKWKALDGDNSEDSFDWARSVTQDLQQCLGSTFYVLKDAVRRQQATVRN